MLLVSEVYRAILGESSESGRLCAIVRLTGCHRRCAYCDSAHAFQGGERRELPSLLAEVSGHGCRTVLVTGGEPLLQTETPALLAALVAAGHRVVLETSGTRGTVGLAAVPPGVRRVVDVKTPGSGLDPAVIDWEGLRGLGPDDEAKFVICDRADYLWARELVREGTRLPAATGVLFSPAAPGIAPHELAEWILDDRLDVRFQLQLHKVLWPGRERGT
ncbi:MAG: radical SAM protein [Candidatus Krumholzibacteriia bacterium]